MEKLSQIFPNRSKAWDLTDPAIFSLHCPNEIAPWNLHLGSSESERGILWDSMRFLWESPMSIPGHKLLEIKMWKNFFHQLVLAKTKRQLFSQLKLNEAPCKWFFYINSFKDLIICRKTDWLIIVKYWLKTLFFDPTCYLVDQKISMSLLPLNFTEEA